MSGPLGKVTDNCGQFKSVRLSSLLYHVSRFTFPAVRNPGWGRLPVCLILTRMMYRPLTRLERSCLVHILAAVLLSSNLLDGLELRAADPAPLPTKNYWGDTNRFLDQQAIVLLGAVQEVLAQSPPTLPEPAARRPALLLLDAALHEADAPKRAPVQEFFHRRMAQAALEIEQTRVESGAVLWKLYDHAFVVRTRAVTLAFDLTRAHSAGVAAFALPDALADQSKILNSCKSTIISPPLGGLGGRTQKGDKSFNLIKGFVQRVV